MDSSSSSASSSSTSSSREHNTAGWAALAKRPAGRTKFRETRHPVYRGVRRRGSNGRWVCEVRVPGKRGARLWFGTYVTAEAAARANHAAMLALGGRSATACLNFADSAWLLSVPSALSDLRDVRRAAVEAVADFQRRQAVSAPHGTAAAEEPSCSDSSASSSADSTGSWETSGSYADAVVEVPVTMDSDMFRFDVFAEMDLGTYYMSLAEALLMDPPPPATTTGAYWDNADCFDGGADVALWSY
ncbi:dehydration-responsive element-binding protein 1H-like [Lolium rigidum]|uniref:dehydration-responsive element-binding protein 1H-like n=1 Tax=Lolium rigidum TaxID=89674 RepID=UPI001F5D78AD|nr:dehydration-responsive element-binding protein 1H-like [Lolium rigidum]